MGSSAPDKGAVVRGPKGGRRSRTRDCVASGANALTPRDRDLTPVLGPGIHHHDPLAYNTPGRGSRWPALPWRAACPLISLAPGGGADAVGGAARAAPCPAPGPVSPFGRLLLCYPRPRPRPP